MANPLGQVVMQQLLCQKPMRDLKEAEEKRKKSLPQITSSYRPMISLIFDEGRLD